MKVQISDNHYSEGSSEVSPLIRKTSFNQLQRRYRNSRKCVSSKAALIILLWSFVVFQVYLFVLNPNEFRNISLHISQYSLIATSGYAAITQCFYPLAGHLADTRFGRHKTILTSLWMILLAVLTISISFGVLLVALSVSRSIYILVIIIGAIIVIALGVLLLTINIAGVNANVIQFGLDQLHDSPGEDQSLFIHWYMWTYYAATVTVNAILSIVLRYHFSAILSYSLLGFLSFTIILVLIVSLSVAHRRQCWFHIEPSRLNPYKLVYRVTKFASQHKVPVRRSAFTYCEDEVPSGLDLGKAKYGGPFTTEQVEDVKTFYGILKVLFSLGPVFFMNIARDSIQSLFPRHVSNNTHSGRVTFATIALQNIDEMTFVDVFLDNNMIFPLTACVCIPLYLFILRPLIRNYIPGMLRRLGIGIFLTLLSLISTFLMDMTIHVENRNVNCILSTLANYSEPYNSSTIPHPYMEHSIAYIKYLLIIQQILTALSQMLFYVALYEFISSQSPHSMKGLLIGLSYAIKGLFETLASAMVIPFSLGWHSKLLPSCGMVYYLVNIGEGLVAILVFVYVARRYKLRERDEPCNVRRYVEDYYSNIQQERFYDYN